MLFAAVAIYITFVGALYLLQDKAIFPAPQQIGPVVNDGIFGTVFIDTPDGEKLFALHHPAEAGQATILVFHGNGDTAHGQRAKGYALERAGFGVLLLEYRGYPGSTGKSSEKGLITDGLTAYDYIVANSRGAVGVYAHSLGTGVAVQVASRRNMAALVLESPYDSLASIVSDRFPWVPVGLLLRHPFHSDRHISSVKVPILIIHGDRDRVIPIEHGKALLQHASKGTRFVALKGGGHNNLAQFGSIEVAVDLLKKALP